MSLVVIGGHSRNVGKTSVVAGLIAALPEFRWIAMKITPHGHDLCPQDGGPGPGPADQPGWAVSEETERSGLTDTSRFLVAGAKQAWWVRSREERLAEALPAIRKLLATSENAILESNSILKFLQPDVYLTVLDPATTDFKQSASEFLDRADALILHNTEGNSTWQEISLKPAPGRPVFFIRPPEYVTPEMVRFVRGKLKG